MIEIGIDLRDGRGAKTISLVRIVRGEAHPKFAKAFYYEWRAVVKELNARQAIYQGKLLHSYDNGAIALAAKVTKAILKQQKDKRDAKRH